ncbi:sphingomyelin phosphodiesterase [Streptomyces chartreusis]|uniref:sphingomyelin phosphodiesterase n=1 Tax=Streptomyces chartreusis TaxID=1969 RepID=UPI002E18B30B
MAGERSGQDAPEGLRIATYNAMLLSNAMCMAEMIKGVGPFHDEERASEMVGVLAATGADVIVLQELFGQDASASLMAGLYQEGYLYQTHVLGAGYWVKNAALWDVEGRSHTWVENGGVAIASAHPLARREARFFTEESSCGYDAYAAKGFVYVEIDVWGRRVHLVGTHPQSTDPGCISGSRPADTAARCRARQFTEIDTFLTALETEPSRIGPDEHVFIVGDLNVDRFNSREYPAMLAALRAWDADRHMGGEFSLDTYTNDIAKARYAGLLPEDLDYVLQRVRGGRARMSDWQVRLERPLTGLGMHYKDLSDHYLLIADGRFPHRPRAT